MQFKSFLLVVLGAAVLSPAYAGGQSHSYRSHSHWRPTHHRSHAYVYRHGPRYHTSFYLGPSVYSRFGYRRYAPVYSYYNYYDEPAYAVESSSHAINGLLLGAVAGAVIGNNSSDLRHNPWRGAALGAATGYVLGSIADARSPQRAFVSAATPPAVASTTVLTAGTAPVAGSAQRSPSTRTAPSMAAANTLFGR